MSDVLQDIIDRAIEQAKQKRERDNYNLGNLIEDLEKYPSNAYVSIEPFGLYPTGFGSYRGYYEDLSIGYTTEKYNEKVLDCGKLLEKAKECVGKTFYGYKGGEFTMTKNSVIWLSNYGDATSVILTGVEDMFENGQYLKLNWKIVE